MATQKINQINYAGITYQFVDEEAQDNITQMSAQITRVSDKLTTELNDEIARAKAAEAGITGSVVMKEAGKGLSSNDYTDQDKAKVQGLKIMTGATDMTDGASGQVPAPLKGEQDKYLKADGTWETPPDTIYEEATPLAAGLMSAMDKVKVDVLEPSDDIVGSTTTFGSNSITQVFASGKSVVTTFNADGSISESITLMSGRVMNFKTIFNADGSIERKAVWAE